jgi:hypothetical protein
MGIGLSVPPGRPLPSLQDKEPDDEPDNLRREVSHEHSSKRRQTSITETENRDEHARYQGCSVCHRRSNRRLTGRA